MADPITLNITTGGGGTVGPALVPDAGLDVGSYLPGGGGGGGGGQGGGGGSSRVGYIRQAIRKAGRRDRLKWAQAIDVAADEENVDPVFLALVVASTPGAMSAEKIRQLAKQSARAFYNSGTIQGAWEALGGSGSIGAYRPRGYQWNFGGPIDETVEGGGGGGSGGGGGGSGGGSTKLTPEQSVQLSLYKSAYRESLTNPWVTVGKNGKLKLHYTINKPKGAIARYEDFQKAWEDINELYEAFLGRKAKAKEVALIVKKGWSSYTIQNMLSKKPGFTKSRIWKSAAPAIEGVAKDILGLEVWSQIPVKERNEFIRKAIVNDWSQATIAENLRKRPEYLKGVEFQTTVSSLRSVYEGIYGVPTETGMRTIQEAALGRWTPDQFATWLRAQPSYTGSPEYLSKALNLLDQLGMIFGTSGPALVPGAAPANIAPAPAGPFPDSPRIPGAPGAPESPVPGLVPVVGV